jgi:hypothetical protein
MTDKDINDAQDYLIIDYGGRRKRILDITTLLQNHSEDAVIRFLKSLLREKQKVMRSYLVKDRTSPCLDEAVSESFRIGMAITVLENESEVTISDELIKQGAGESGELSGGNGGGYSSAR